MNKNKIRYTEYYGDGDTKSFSAIENVYGEKSVIKRERIGHVQKRVGTRLRKLKKTEKGLGKLGLNDAVIDKLQTYNGIATRGNVGSLEAMHQKIIIFMTIAQKAQIFGACTKSMSQTILLLYVPGKGLHSGAIRHVKACEGM